MRDSSGRELPFDPRVTWKMGKRNHERVTPTPLEPLRRRGLGLHPRVRGVVNRAVRRDGIHVCFSFWAAGDDAVSDVNLTFSNGTTVPASVAPCPMRSRCQLWRDRTCQGGFDAHPVKRLLQQTHARGADLTLRSVVVSTRGAGRTDFKVPALVRRYLRSAPLRRQREWSNALCSLAAAGLAAAAVLLAVLSGSSVSGAASPQLQSQHVSVAAVQTPAPLDVRVQAVSSVMRK